MLRYAKRVGQKLGRFVREEVGQNVIETALIIGVVSLVLVLGFMGTDIQAQVTDLGREVACEVQGGVWTENANNPGACVFAP